MKKRTDGRYVKKISMPNGSYKYLYSNAKTEREAIKDFNRQLLEIEDNNVQKMKFKNVAENWLDTYLNRVSYINYKKSTKAAYERTVEHFGEINVQQITLQSVDAFLDSLIRQGYYRKTISSHKSVINQIMRYAVYQGYIPFNPVRDLKLPSNLPEDRRDLPSTEELRIVNSHYEGFDFLPYFLLNTGARISEAVALSDEDFDMENKTAMVNKHMVWDSNNPIIVPKTKTKAGERKLVIIDRVYDKLPKFKGLLFCNSDGTPLTKGQLRKRWEKYQKTYGLTVTAHQLRHAFATMCFEADLDVKDTQRLMGHSDIELTKKIYTHIREERVLKSIDKLNNFEF